MSGRNTVKNYHQYSVEQFQVVLDGEGAITFASDTFFEFNNAPEDQLTNYIYSFLSEKDTKLFKNTLKSCIDKPGSTHRITTLSKNTNSKQNSRLFWNLSCRYKSNGTSEIIADATVQPDHNSAANSIDLLKKISGQIPGAIFEFRFDENHPFAFTYLSEGIEALSGVSAEKLINDFKAAFDRFHPEDIQKVQKSIVDAGEFKSIWTLEFRVLHPVKGLIWLRSRAKPEIRKNQPTLWHGIVLDVTNEVQLREQERLMALISANTNNMIVVTNPDKKIEWVNKSFTQLTGYTLEEIKGRSPGEVLQGPETLPQIKKEISKSLNESHKYQGEILNYTKAGKPYWTSLNIQPMYNDRGELIKYFAIERDITEEKESRQQIQRLLKGIEQSPATVVITDTNGNIQYVNPKFEEVTGYNKEEVLGKNPRILKSGHQDDDYYQKLWTTISSGHEWRGELLNKKKDGELYWESATISPVKNDKGKITHYIAVKEDINERKRNEAYIKYLSKIQDVLTNIAQTFINIPVSDIESEIERSLDMIGNIVNVDCIYLVDFDYARKTAHKTIEWISGKHELEPLNIDNVKLSFFNSWIEKLRDNGLLILDSDTVDETTEDSPDSFFKIRNGFHIILPLAHDNDIYGFIGLNTVSGQRIFRDEEYDLMHVFTKLLVSLKIRSKSEQQLLDSQSRLIATLDVVSEQNKRLLDFTSILSHNIRSHAANIKGIVDIMYESVDEDESEHIKSLLKSASDELINTLSHLNQTINIQKNRNPEKEEIRLRSFVQDTLYSIRDQITEHKAEIGIEISKNVTINYNKSYLSNVILSLCTNAIRYRHPDRRPQITFECNSIDGKNSLKVSDNGLGIDLDKHGYRLFGMYQVFHENPESRGLGLFIVKNQIEAMGGSIDVESTPGRGTSFIIHL